MKANKMLELARLYGLNLQQYFTIDGYDGKFYFDYEGLRREGDGSHFEFTLANILRGDLKIKPVGYYSGEDDKEGCGEVNYYERVANMFGLKLIERFVVEESGDHVPGLPNEVLKSTFMFTTQGISKATYCEFWDSVILPPLLKGALTIYKIWKPAFGDDVYFPDVSCGEARARGALYDGGQFDKKALEAGIICKNKQEAEEKAKAMLQAVKEYDEKRNIHRVA